VPGRAPRVFGREFRGKVREVGIRKTQVPGGDAGEAEKARERNGTKPLGGNARSTETQKKESTKESRV